MSPLLPWLAILALLALKPNRNWSAWWIWLPLAGLVAGWHRLELGLQSSNTGPSEGRLGVLLAIPIALVFGLAALWLMASYLGGHRFRTFLGMLAVLVVFIVFSFAATAGWGLVLEPLMGLVDPRHCAGSAGTGERALPFLVPLALLALTVAAAMALSGLACRGRPRQWLLCLCLFLSLPTVWVAASSLLHFLCWIASSSGADYRLLLMGLPVVVITFGTLLPFLVLSWVNALFRERLKALFQLEPLQKSAPVV